MQPIKIFTFTRSLNIVILQFLGLANKTSGEDLLNLFSIEYNGIFNLKIGDIHTIESRGLVFNSYQDQSTDFDNGYLE